MKKITEKWQYLIWMLLCILAITFFKDVKIVHAEENNYGWSAKCYVNGEEKSTGYFSNNRTIELELKITGDLDSSKVTYQWYKGFLDGICDDGGKESEAISIKRGGLSSQVTIKGNDLEEGRYTCKTIVDGEISWYWYDLYRDYSISEYINDEDTSSINNTVPGKKYRLRIEANSDNKNFNYQYSWYKKYRTNEGEEKLQKLSSIGNEIAVIKTEDAKERYYVEVTDDNGQKRTADMSLGLCTEKTLKTKLKINDKSWGENDEGDTIYRNLKKGVSVKMEVDAESSLYSNFQYIWKKNGQILKQGDDNTYIVSSFEEKDERYECVVQDGENSIECLFELQPEETEPQPEPESTFEVTGYYIENGNKVRDKSFLEIRDGDSVKLGIDIDKNTNEDKQVSYKWFIRTDDEEESSENQQKPFSTEAEITLGEIRREERYYCIVSNGKEQREIHFWVTKTALPIYVESQITGSLYINGIKQNKYGSEIDIDPEVKLEDIRFEVRAKSPNKIVSYKWYRFYGEGMTEYIANGKSYTLAKERIYKYGGATGLECQVKEEKGGTRIFWVSFNKSDHTQEAQCYIANDKDNEGTLAKGQSTILKVVPQGKNLNYTYEWYDADGNRLQGNGGSLAIIKKEEEVQQYYCKLKCGSYMSKYIFTIYPSETQMVSRWLNDKKIEKIYDGDEGWRWEPYYIPENGIADMKVKIYGANKSETYQWYKGNQKIEGATQNVLKETVKEGDSYKCIITGNNINKSVPFYFITRPKEGKVECNHEANYIVIDDAVPATCEMNGLTEGKHCGSCGEVIVQQKIIKARGHEWNRGVIIKQPTVQKEGIKRVTCSICHKNRDEVLPKLALQNNRNLLQKGQKITDKKTKAIYKILDQNTVEYVKLVGKNKKVVVPNKIIINGRVYKVVSISQKAFKGNKTMKKLVISQNIKNIGKYAFCGCKSLKNIEIKTPYLTKKTVGKNSFKGIFAKATIKVPKKQKKLYQKLLVSKGVGKKVKIKK